MPKTFKNLYPQICDFDNVYQAWRHSACFIAFSLNRRTHG